MLARTLLRSCLPVVVTGLSLVACADDDVEVVDSSADELKNAPAGKLQVYNMNTHHLSEPGKPSFEETDFRQLIAYMREQTYLPDVILLSEVGRNNSVPSQPCSRFTRELERVLAPKGKIQYTCEVARGRVGQLENAGGGTAIVYRQNLKPLKKIVLKNLVLDGDKCVEEDDAHTGLTFIQTFQDGKHTAAVASLHLVSPTTEGATNQYGRDCSATNLRRITDALDKVQADVKILGGDMNHADAQRHVEGGNVVHDHWEAGYAHTVKFLAKGNNPNAGYKDPWFGDCARSCGVDASEKASYSSTQTQCISACIAKTTSLGRIDWLFAKGASAIAENVSIPFADARAAFIRQTGDQGAVAKYSDHLAQRFLVTY